MSDTEEKGGEKSGCQVCAAFEPQAWRKSLCRNCFHTLEEHSEELLAKEAEAVAKEKAEKDAGKPKEASSKAPGAKPDATKTKEASSPAGKNAQGKASNKDAKAEKDSAAKDAKAKHGANKAAGKSDGPWSWAKDLGLEYAKPGSKTGAQPAAAGVKGKAPTSTASATSASTSSTTTSSSSSSKSSPKSATSSSTASAATTPSTATSTSSTAATTTTTSTSSTTTTTSTTAMSKAKSFASKFDSLAAELVKDKPSSKSSDLRPGSSTVASLPSKSSDDAVDSKTSSKSQDTKASDSTKSLGSKVDSKAPWKKSEDTSSKFSKGGLTKTKEDDKKGDDKEVKKDEDIKDKKSLQHKTEEKDSKFQTSTRSKVAPFGKDMLKSMKEKDSNKKDGPSSHSGDENLNTSKTKDDILGKGKDSLKSGSPKESGTVAHDKPKLSPTAKFTSGKFYDDKSKKEGTATAKTSASKLKSSDVGQNAQAPEGKLAADALRSPRVSEQTDAGRENKLGHLAKAAGKSAEDKTSERPESKDNAKLSKGTDDVTGKCQNNTEDASASPDSSKVDKDKSSVYRDRGKEKGRTEGEGARKEDTSATLPSPPVGGKQVSSTLSPSPSSKPTTPTTPSSSSADSKLSSPFFSGSKAAADKKPKDLKLDTGKVSRSSLSPLDKFKGLEKTSDKDSLGSSPKSPATTSPQPPAKKDDSKDKTKENATAGSPVVAKDGNQEKLTVQLKEKEEKLADLLEKLSKMEEKVKTLEVEKEQLRKTSIQSQKEDMEKLLKELRAQLSKMESQCSRLETDNQALIDKLHAQEASVKRDQECRGKNSDNTVLEQDLEAAEQELEEMKDENKELQRQIMEMKNEMDEMYDHFREHEHDEFRELQKELDLTAKNCRILQFKLRKAERRNDQIEEDRIHYEEKLRMLQDQFDSQDAKNHIRLLEEELRMAKEVSVRLHDELDIIEDRKNKALEENKHLTELLEHTDKRQFRMEMEIDKLRDIVQDLRQQLKEARSGSNNNNNNNKESSPDRRVLSSIYTRSYD